MMRALGGGRAEKGAESVLGVLAYAKTIDIEYSSLSLGVI